MAAKKLKPLRRIEPLEMEIDSRLGRIRNELLDFFADEEEDVTIFVAALVRAAYGNGLIDGARDPSGTKKVIKSLGYRLR